MRKQWFLAVYLGLTYIFAVVRRAGSLDAWLVPHWDGVHYLSIAERGYEISKCTNPMDLTKTIYCGNPWFPGWPYFCELIWKGLGLRSLGVPLDTLFFVLGALCFLALLIVSVTFSKYLFIDAEKFTATQSRNIGAWATAGLLCQPASFYFLTQFPYTFCFLTGFLFLVAHRSPASLGLPTRLAQPVAGALGFWSSLAYPTGLFFSLYPLGEFLRTRNPKRDFKKPQRWLVAAAWGAIFGAGTLVVCLIFQYKFGLFNLYFVHQYQWPRSGNLFTVLLDLLRYGHENERLAFLWYAFGLMLVCLRVPRIAREPSLWFVLASFAINPSTGSWVSIYRYYLFGFPLFALLGAADCSFWLKFGYLAVGVWFQFGDLLPKYVTGNLM